LGIGCALPLLPLSGLPREVAQSLWGVALVAAIAGFVIRGVDCVTAILEHRAIAGGADDEFRRRGIRTQVEVLRRLAHVATGVLAVAFVLMQFEVVRSIGVSLLAS